MSQEPTVLSSYADGVGRITMNRPDNANAFSRRFARDMAAAIDAVLAEPGLRAVLIAARGRIFCAGGDIAEFVEQRERLPGLVEEILDPLLPAFARLVDAPVPVVSAVNGPIGGAGIGMALCADIVLAAESMKLRGGYSAIGLSPDLGASWLLARRIGAARAKEVFLLNRSYDARRCLEMGVVNEVHADDRLMAQAEEMVAKLAAGPRSSQAAVKRLCDAAAGATLAGHLEAERRALVANAGTADAREGVAAFIEKRAARFGQA